MLEPDVGGDARQVIADVPGADDEEPRRRRERIDVHVHAASADESVLLREVVVQLVVEQRRLPDAIASRAFQNASFS